MSFGDDVMMVLVGRWCAVGFRVLGFGRKIVLLRGYVFLKEDVAVFKFGF